MKIQGRELSQENIQWICKLILDHLDWHRTRISREICSAWNCVNLKGQLKDMACRTMLLKLERLGYLRLPAKRTVCVGNSVKVHTPVDHSTTDIACSLHDLVPIRIDVVDCSGSRSLAVS